MVDLDEFEILMEPDDGGFHVWCPVLRGGHSWGQTRTEARAMIRQAIELWLEDADDEAERSLPERERITLRVS